MSLIRDLAQQDHDATTKADAERAEQEIREHEARRAQVRTQAFEVAREALAQMFPGAEWRLRKVGECGEYAAVICDDEPDLVFFVDTAKRVFVGSPDLLGSANARTWRDATHWVSSPRDLLRHLDDQAGR